MTTCLRNLRGEHETLGRLLIPTLDSRFRGRAVKGGVNLHGVKFRAVVRQVFTFGQTLGIERAESTDSGERACADANVSH